VYIVLLVVSNWKSGKIEMKNFFRVCWRLNSDYFVQAIVAIVLAIVRCFAFDRFFPKNSYGESQDVTLPEAISTNSPCGGI
jgi:hypothetical protein